MSSRYDLQIKLQVKRMFHVTYRIAKLNEIEFIRYLPEFNFADRTMEQYNHLVFR